MRNTVATESPAGKLGRFPVFSALPVADIESVAAMVRVRRYPKGAFIVTRGESANGLYLLSSGRAKLTIASPDGKELVLGHLDAPAHFGETSLVEGQQHTADVVAVADVEVLVLDARDLAGTIRLQPALAVSLIGALSQRLRETIARLEDLTFHDAAHRVMRVLLNIATARCDSSGAPLIRGFTHYDIATLSGTSRETASRVISSLARDGIVEVRGRAILVDMERLRSEMSRA
jgi:CRP-like cAMP-binding protein